MTTTHTVHRTPPKRGLFPCQLLLGVSAAALCTQPIESWAGPKGTIHARYLSVSPTMDGRLSDWPLDQYQVIAQHPEFPEVRDSDSSFADGNQLVFSLDRIGRFNQTSFLAWIDGDRYSDFGSSVYFGYDSKFLYVLTVTIDDVAQGGRDTTEFGSSGGLNDGFGLLIDARGDSAECVADRDFPRFNNGTPHTDDFQITAALNNRFKPAGADADEWGARQVIEQAGLPALMAVKGGAVGQYQQALDRSNTSDGQRDIVARHYSDLRAAGALNPELFDESTRIFSGYIIEMRIPFSASIGFVPDHDMGIELFWRDADGTNDPGHGANDVSWGAWAQSSELDCANPRFSLMNAANWAKLVFDGAASIGNMVFRDSNSNGIQDAGELGVDGVRVEVIRCQDNAVMGVTTTSDGGLYSFALQPGDYRLKFSGLPASHVFSPSTPSPNSDALDSDSDPVTGMTACTTLVAGESDSDWDAGIYPLERPQIRRQGNSLVLSWSGQGTVEQTDSLIGGGQWAAVQNAKSPFTIAPSTTYRFYRVVR
jgi:hypothetical protein